MKTRNLISHTLLTATAVFAASLGNIGTTHAQLVSGWGAPRIDDGNGDPDRVNAWITDVATGDFDGLTVIASAQALAADNSRGLIYSTTGSSISTFGLDDNGNLVQVGSSVGVQDTNGIRAESDQVAAMGFARDVIYAFIGRKATDARRNRGIPAGLYTIVPSTGIATLIRSSEDFPFFEGIGFNPADGLMYAIAGSTNAQSIVTFDLDTFTVTAVADVPTSAYGGPAQLRLDGVAVGDGKVYLTSRSDDVRIAVYDIASGTFGPSLLNPPRFGENTSYPGGSTFFAPQSNVPPPVCGDDICNGAENACSCARDCGVAPAETCDNGIDDDCDGSADCEDLDCAAEPICIAPPPSASLSCDDLARFDSARCFADTLFFVVSTTSEGDVEIEVNGSRAPLSLERGTNIVRLPASSGPATVAITDPAGCFQALTTTCR